MKVLFLDDNVFRQRAATVVWSRDQLTIVDTAGAAINSLRSHRFDYVSLDHDLGGQVLVDSGREDCGMEVVRFLVAHQSDIGTINVHSWNMPAADRMVGMLRGAGYSVERRLFGDNGFHGG